MLNKNHFFIRSWKAILGILMLGSVLFLAGWKALDVVAQGPSGSEPGASSGQSGGVTQNRVHPSSPVTATGPYTPSEPGSSAYQVGVTSPDQRPQSPQQAGAGSSSPSEVGSSIPAAVIPARSIPGPDIISSWPNHWYTVMGSTFTPSDSTTTYVYYLSGCVTPTSGGQWRASVNLPDGSVIKYVYVNYNNSTGSLATTVWLTSYKYDGTLTDLVSVNSRPFSTTGAGYFSDLSSEITVTVDNLNYGYAFVWGGGSAGPTQRLCSVQVGYIPPSVFGLALPMVQK
jgi:hypothetical protein